MPSLPPALSVGADPSAVVVEEALLLLLVGLWSEDPSLGFAPLEESLDDEMLESASAPVLDANEPPLLESEDEAVGAGVAVAASKAESK